MNIMVIKSILLNILQDFLILTIGFVSGVIFAMYYNDKYMDINLKKKKKK